MSKTRRGKSTSRFYALLGLIALVGVGGLGYAAMRKDAPPAPSRAVDPALAKEARGQLLGDPKAPVTITEFADFECPACAQFATVTGPDVKKRLVETGQANFRFYDYPLPMHGNAWPAAHAAACAAEQGKFWDMHDRIFAGQTEWNTQATNNPKRVFEGYVRALGMNADQWEQCFDSQKYLRQIQANMAEGDRRQIRGTPTLYVNDREATGHDYDHIKALVDSAKTAVAGAGGAAAAPRDTAAGTASVTRKQ